MDTQDVQKIVIGIDLGSITAKIVFLDQNEKILEHHYLRHKGHPGEIILNLLEDIEFVRRYVHTLAFRNRESEWNY